MATTLGQKKFYTLSVNEKKPDEFGDVLNTLEDVTSKGNYTAVPINFVKDSTDGSLGMNTTTYSMFFGNMNPDHTGTYNVSYGYNSLSLVTTGYSNTAIGSYAGEKITTGTSNTLVGADAMSVGTGYKNTYIGASAGQDETTGDHNCRLGYMSGIGSTIGGRGNVYLGTYSGQRHYGNNNVFIGFGAGVMPLPFPEVNINNRLIIHSNTTISGQSNTTPGIWNDRHQSSIDNGLIVGDFADRWVKFNGKFSINPSHIPNAQGDALFAKQIVAKADGTFGWEDKIPLPPQTGNYKLISTNGIMSWVEEVI